MNDILSSLTTWHFALAAVVVLFLVGYFYWADVRKAFGSRYRAYDLLFLTAGIGILLARIAVIAEDNSVYLADGAEWIQLVSLGDLNFDYLILLFAPLLAQQLFVFNIVATKNWRSQSSVFLKYGELFLLAMVVIQLGRAIAFEWGTDHILYHGIQAGWLIGNLALFSFFGKQQMISKVPFIYRLLLVSGGLLVSLLVYPQDGSRVDIIFIVQVLLLCLVLIPFTSRQRPTLSAPPRSKHGITNFYK